MDDLLGMDVGGSSAPTPVPGSAAAIQQTQLVGDSMDDLLGSAAPTPTPAAAAPGMANGGGGAMDDLLALDAPQSIQPSTNMLGGLGGGAPAAPAPLLQPLSIDINTLGAQWESVPFELQAKAVTGMPLSVSDMMLRLESHMNARKVEIIGNEGIAAAQYGNGRRCFIHGNVQGNMVEVQIKCDDLDMAQKAQALCNSALVK